MARIDFNNIKRVEKNNNINDIATATYHFFEIGGEKYFQFGTYGKPTLEVSTQPRQKIQFNKETSKKKKFFIILLNILLTLTLISCEESSKPQTSKKEEAVKNVSEDISHTTPEHYKGKWAVINEQTGVTLKFTISIDNINQTMGNIYYAGTADFDIPINQWEPIKNFSETSKDSYPNGYKLWIKEKDGQSSFVFLFRHYEDNDRVLFKISNLEVVLNRVGI